MRFTPHSRRREKIKSPTVWAIAASLGLRLKELTGTISPSSCQRNQAGALRCEALHQGCEMTHAFGPAEQLAIQANALEPVVQPQQIGEAHAAVNLGRDTRNELSDFRGVRLGVRGRERRFGRNGV